MATWDVFFEKSDDMREAERDLRQREDHLMAVDERELKECPVHATKDAERQSIVLGRVRLLQTTQEQNSNRNLKATVLSSVAVVSIVKGGSIAEWLMHFLNAL